MTEKVILTDETAEVLVQRLQALLGDKRVRVENERGFHLETNHFPNTPRRSAVDLSRLPERQEINIYLLSVDGKQIFTSYPDHPVEFTFSDDRVQVDYFAPSGLKTHRVYIPQM